MALSEERLKEIHLVMMLHAEKKRLEGFGVTNQESRTEFLNWPLLQKLDTPFILQKFETKLQIDNPGVSSTVRRADLKGEESLDGRWVAYELVWKNELIQNGLRVRASEKGEVRCELVYQGKWTTVADYIRNPAHKASWEKHIEEIHGPIPLEHVVEFAYNEQIRKV